MEPEEQRKPSTVDVFRSTMTNETAFLPVAPHSDGHEFPAEIGTYRGIVEEAVFQCIGRPGFFDRAVEMVMGRIQEKIQKEATSGEKACATRATQEFAELGNGRSMRFNRRPNLP